MGEVMGEIGDGCEPTPSRALPSTPPTLSSLWHPLQPLSLNSFSPLTSFPPPFPQHFEVVAGRTGTLNILQRDDGIVPVRVVPEAVGLLFVRSPALAVVADGAAEPVRRMVLQILAAVPRERLRSARHERDFNADMATGAPVDHAKGAKVNLLISTVKARALSLVSASCAFFTRNSLKVS